MITPLAYVDSLHVGSVDYVSPDEIKVLLDIESPSDVALNTGTVHPFPRVGGYVLIPSESNFLVAQIEWITIERSQYPKRKGMKDFGIIDLPFPLRKMSLTPLGILREYDGKKKLEYSFSRGVEVLPTVGDPVLLPASEQLKAIVESGENHRIKIGTSPLASNANVFVDPDRLFGRHLAVLGNTGGGKSCSVAGLIRWSIEAANVAKKEIKDIRGIETGEDRKRVGLDAGTNSRFIILDPNGEYSQAFRDMENIRLFAVEADEEEDIKQLQVPLWFWNSAEWCAFTQAGRGAQRPTLIQALRTVRDGRLESSLAPSTEMRRYLRTLISLMSIEIANGTPLMGGGRTKGLRDRIVAWEAGLIGNERFSENQHNAIATLKQAIAAFFDSNQSDNSEWPLYTKPSADLLLAAIKNAHASFGGTDQDMLPIDADVPRPFTGDMLLASIQANAELMGTTEYVEPMLMRIRTLLSDSRMKKITNCTNDLTLTKWLNDYLCPNNSSEGAITVIDLSLVPAEVVHVVTAVIARMILEALQRYRHLNEGETLPTTLVMEEAHTFIRKYKSDSEDTPSYAMCTQVFEKIAREGRKFGLGLVLSSQRPSELSSTVLAQCNTFLLHRISNDQDQKLVSSLLPDNLRGLLRELPMLPSQRAILLGWASELPVMVQMKYLNKEQRPQSQDPTFWDSWTASGDDQRTPDWTSIVDDWQDIGQMGSDATEPEVVQDEAPAGSAAATSSRREESHEQDEV